MKAYIMRGIPGSGKSTFSNSLGLPIVSADLYFMKDGEYHFDASKLKDAHSACLRQYIEYIRKGNSVIVDNTNCNVEDVLPYLAIASAYNFDIEIVKFVIKDGMLEQIASRNSHQVPVDTCKRMYNRLMSFSLPKRFKDLEKEIFC